MNQADCAHGGTPLTPAQSAYRAVHLENANLMAIHAGSHGQARPGESGAYLRVGTVERGCAEARWKAQGYAVSPLAL